MTDLRFDGRVAIVTGSGNGLGKAYALLLGSRGCSVVVNDLGGGRSGEGQDSRAADLVVQEIKDAGGSACPDYHSVEDGAAVVETALSTFGRLDILVNNAGILRDKSFARTSDQDWNLVQRVHLFGSFSVTRAAFPVFKKQGYGRIIMTSSVAGIYGNFGQANYSSAKLGLHGLCQTVAIEGARYNISCNTVAPMGGTRLTEDVLPPELFAGLKPELIAPLVAWLCHEHCTETGGLFEAAGGWYGKYRFERSQGAVCRGDLDALVTPEAVRDRWADITDFTGALHPTSTGEVAGLLTQVLEDLRDGAGSSPGPEPSLSATPAAAIGFTEPPVTFSYTAKDVVLYALGVGAGVTSDLHLVYEQHDQFAPLATYGIMAAQAALLDSALLVGGAGGWMPDVTRILHGEQYVRQCGPLPPSGTLQAQLTVRDVLDKGSGALIVIDLDVTLPSDGSLVTSTQWLLFVAGAGNFGGKRTSSAVKPLVKSPGKDKKPDKSVRYKTSEDQAALYRLSGDLNPLHIDPNFAAMGGFDRPILHGLCTLGVATRVLTGVYAQGDPSRVRAVKTRFSATVLPGHTVRTDMWKQDMCPDIVDNDGTPLQRILFTVTNEDTGDTVLTGGYVDIVPDSSAAQGSPRPVQDSPCTPVFEELARRVDQSQGTLVPRVGGIFLFKITDPGNTAAPPELWTVNLKTPPGSVSRGTSATPDVTLTMNYDTLMALVKGQLNPQKAFMAGQLRVAGNLVLSQKLKELFGTQTSKV